MKSSESRGNWIIRYKRPEYQGNEMFIFMVKCCLVAFNKQARNRQMQCYAENPNNTENPQTMYINNGVQRSIDMKIYKFNDWLGIIDGHNNSTIIEIDYKHKNI